MKIAFIGQKGIPATSGGIEKHVEEVAVRMAKQGHKVFVYVRDNYTDKDLRIYQGVELVHLPSIPTKHLDAISHTFFSALHALFQNYDVVHYQGIGPNLLNWITKIFNPGVATISTFHCQDYLHQKWGWVAKHSLKLGEYITCTVPDAVVAVSNSLAGIAKKQYGSEAIVIPNGAQVSYSASVNQLTQWGLEDKKYILSVGRLIKHKGVHYLIEAFKQLEETEKLPEGFKLVIVGDGFHTDDYVGYLRNISAGSKNIIFTGAQSGETLKQLFSHAYLFVQPSETEGLSIALLEAMGYGLAPLVSDIKENLEPIGDCGFSFESKNIDSLYEKLSQLLYKQTEIKATGECAKNKIAKEYNWDLIAEKTLAVYENIISSKKNDK